MSGVKRKYTTSKKQLRKKKAKQKGEDKVESIAETCLEVVHLIRLRYSWDAFFAVRDPWFNRLDGTCKFMLAVVEVLRKCKPLDFEQLGEVKIDESIDGVEQVKLIRMYLDRLQSKQTWAIICNRILMRKQKKYIHQGYSSYPLSEGTLKALLERWVGDSVPHTPHFV